MQINDWALGWLIQQFGPLAGRFTLALVLFLDGPVHVVSG